ncbi:gamma-butyrobetaine dioxygenase-like [Sabethes cyaneus]|uniref:gamma-butyrobetaine dioxygenase-like n=1 Tax=Sabethes cyaneus TaxID=53552 RepID=UPI00237ED471|nr:gamma-butyrobetaine dioxygenase-like [Sabethes cyaneus]
MLALRNFNPRLVHQLGTSLIKRRRRTWPASCTAGRPYQVVATCSSQPFRGIHSQQVLRKTVSVSDVQNQPAESNQIPLISSASLECVDAGDKQQQFQCLVVELTDGRRYEFPPVWLRDNCQCLDCFHPKSYSRVLNWESFDVDGVQLSECVVTEDRNELELIWSDGHRSRFSSGWLVERNFTEDSRRRYLNEWYRPRPRLWAKREFGEILKKFEFGDVIDSDEALQGWIEALIRYGVVMIKNAPLQETVCRRLADRVGFIRKTHYGEEFIVKAKEGTSNVAYLSTPLQMHTDLPYYDYKPGCNLLHCLVQSRSIGGQNLIADAFYVADRIRMEYPEEFKLLSETLVNWTDVGEDEGGQFHSIYRAPVICIGRDGNLERINHSVPQRDSFFNVPLASVEPWYRAMARFVRLIHQEAVEFKTEPGDILTFSNIRMVHGRTGYEDTDDNTRHIIGAYLDWDEIYSKLRVLKRSLKDF